MRVISIRLPSVYIELIDELVRMGIYPSRSEVIRVALRDFLRREMSMQRRALRILREI
ncbi:MAG: ribbon-helix-helix domain-containing protein [archaeon GB-1867-005]|nr:ribbon-helix-helix domain-containing protein [Candidatus Culexmicrobium cathedralense]